MNKTKDCDFVSESLLSCSISVIITCLTFLSPLLLGLFYWYKTGTFPLREQIHNKITELENLKRERELDEELLRAKEKIIEGRKKLQEARLLIKEGDEFIRGRTASDGKTPQERYLHADGDNGSGPEFCE